MTREQFPRLSFIGHGSLGHGVLPYEAWIIPVSPGLSAYGVLFNRAMWACLTARTHFLVVSFPDLIKKSTLTKMN